MRFTLHGSLFVHVYYFWGGSAFWLNNSGLFVGACATAPHLLNPGEVHDGPPRRTHSIGDLIQRKNKSHFQNCSEILYNVQTIKKNIGYPKHKYNFYWIFSAYRNSLDLRWHRSKTQHPSLVGADIRQSQEPHQHRCYYLHST